MNFQTLSLEREGAIARVTIQRPDALNALNHLVLKELNQMVDHLESLSDLRVVILTGSGEKAFVAGADIKEIDQLSGDSSLEFARFGQSVFRRWERMSVPTIASIQGFALGGGFELALSCDMIVASTKAKFGLPECTLGVIPGFGGTVRLSRLIGVQRAKEMALTGEFYTADQGMALGFVNRVTAPEELKVEVEKLAHTLALRAPLSLKNIKTSIDTGFHLSVDEALELEAELFQDLFSSRDQKEGTQAFIEKRKPVFTGQ